MMAYNNGKLLWKKCRCLEQESNPRPFGLMFGCDTTTPSRQPRWQRGLSLVLRYTSRGVPNVSTMERPRLVYHKTRERLRCQRGCLDGVVVTQSNM